MYRIWDGTWENNLASVDIQDPSINNYVSTISVIRYFLYNNDTGATITVGGSLTVQGETAYTDLSVICGTSKVYADEESDVSYVEDSITNPFKLAVDCLFVVLMLCFMGYIIYRTWKPLKVHRIPLVVRPNNVSGWSFKQRIKTFIFALYMLTSTIFVRYNMMDLSKDCIYCYDDFGCDQVDSLHHASTVLGFSILIPFVLFLILQQFNERMKYLCLPVILINGLFMFVVLLLCIYNYYVFLFHGAYFIFRFLHIFNLLLLLFNGLMIWIVDSCFSTEFDFYDAA